MSKKIRLEVSQDVPVAGGLLDLFDGLMYTFYNITSSELDSICEHASDEELDGFVTATSEGASFSDIRKGIEIRNKYVEFYKSKYENTRP